MQRNPSLIIEIINKEQMTLEEIYNDKEISVRSYNVCTANNLKSLDEILNYYQKHETFINLRNCGNKSNQELTSFCIKHINKENLENTENTKLGNSLKSIINNLTRIQREIVNSYIEINTNNLTIRSKNAITTYLDGNLKTRNISDKILLNDHFQIENLKNVGGKSESELRSFINSIKVFIEKVSTTESESELITLKNRFFIEKTFSISKLPNEILESKSIFKLTDFLIKENAIFEKNKNTIFQKNLKIYKNQPEINLDEIAAELKITKERARQIRKICLEELFTNFQFIKNLDDDLFQKYSIDLNQDFIKLSDDIITLINEKNKTRFSNEFISFLIYVYLSENFEIIGNLEDVLLTKYFNSKNRHNWDNFYIVKKNIVNKFEFNAFANDLDNRLSERIEDTNQFNFKSYLNNFIGSPKVDFYIPISLVSEYILNNEFNLYIDIEDNITFNRNSIKPTYEYAYEALKSIGKPSKVHEITKKIKQLNPDYETNDLRVSSSMIRNNGFVPIGRISIFGLKEWENEIENFKGGTIRSITFEYLERQQEPKHISDVAKYVLLYRPKTYERSILDNLKADETRTFVFFKNNTIGLSSKKYDNSFIANNRIKHQETKSWEESYNDLIQFLNLNNRLPISNGPDDEIRLYNWHRIQVMRLNKGELQDQKSNLIMLLYKNFDIGIITQKINNNKSKNFYDLNQFVRKNKRLPSANKLGEERLYHFYYKQRKLYKQGDLEKDDKSNFIEIENIIKKT